MKDNEKVKQSIDLSKGDIITSVSEFLKKVQEIKNACEIPYVTMLFRGQETEFWNIESSICRANLINLEHDLFQNLLLKIPEEFLELKNPFDIMTKSQHYGLCTRLIDLTTNPLVALFFAAKSHGKENIETITNNESIIENREPHGIVYYRCSDSHILSPSDDEIKIISALSRYNLSKDNKIGSILTKLKQEGYISSFNETRWREKEHVKEFIDIIQNNYIVQPKLDNPRLIRQSGVFLLPGMFNIDCNYNNILESRITKAKTKLMDEFSEDFFYIPGDCKDNILNELNMYNINEATLFPELEYKLKYIQRIKAQQSEDAPDFEKYDEKDIKNINEETIVEIENPNFIKEISFYIDSKIGKGFLAPKIIQCVIGNISIDWYKKESILSKIQTDIMRELIKAGTNRNSARSIAEDIIKNSIRIYSQKAV